MLKVVGRSCGDLLADALAARPVRWESSVVAHYLKAGDLSSCRTSNVFQMLDIAFQGGWI